MKVRVLPFQPHSLAFGGFEIQMLSVLEAVRSRGVDAQPMDVWSRDGDFDILHVWGLDAANMPAVFWAKRGGKRVVMTALLPYLTASVCLRHLASLVIGPARVQRRLLSMVDALVVVNDAQASTARYMGVPKEKIVIAPHIVEAPFFEPSQSRPDQWFGTGDYVLCTGNVCERKNQLRLAQAAAAAGCRLLLIGAPLAGEDRYAEALSRLLSDHPLIRWIKGLEQHSAELVAAYRSAACAALPSFSESQPISLLEAAAAGKPLLMADRPYARQKYYRNACLVEPKSVKSIEQGLRAILAEPGRYLPPGESLAECRSESVGAAYKHAFELAQGQARKIA